MAFGFVETKSGDDSPCGTYYAPRHFFRRRTGEVFESPSIADVTPEMLDYWERRTCQAKHPRLRVRYADLVFDLSERVGGKKPDYHLPHVVVDETLRIAEEGCYRDALDVQVKLKRALDLAIRINDQARLARVRDTILVFEDKTATDNELGTWGFAFDVLIDTTHATGVSEEQEAKIIADLEQRLERVSVGEPPQFDPFAAEPAALRLAHYHRQKDQRDDLRRVLRAYTGAWIRISGDAMPALGAAWLEKVYKLLLDFGLKQEANALEVRLREQGSRAPENLSKVSGKVEISKQEMDQFLSGMTAGGLSDTLARIALLFLPDPDKTKQELLDISEQHPLLSMFTSQLLDRKGRVIAEVGSVEKDLEGRVVNQMAQDMGYWAPFLHIVIESTRGRFHLTGEVLLDFLFRSPAFERERRELTGVGLDAYLRGEYAVAIHVLIPQIEAAVRNLVAMAGGPLYEHKPGPHGGMLLKNLDKLLQDERLNKALSTRITLYLPVLLTDQRGWNLRNDLCHGIAHPRSFGSPMADRVLHALLVLGLIRPEGKEKPTG